MSTLFFKRILAFFIDYLIIVCYAFLLFLISRRIFDLDNIVSVTFSPLKGQVLGFLSLTLPVFLYGFLLEKSRYRGTIGKRICKLKVSSVSNTEADSSSIFFRNVLKYLPWEIAHTGVHWLFYFNRTQAEIPMWVFVLLILPQLIIIYYFITAIISKGEQAYYDKVVAVKLVSRKQHGAD